MQIILIGGAQRSGTTIFQTLLVSALQSTPILPESHILYDLLFAYQKATSSHWSKTLSFYSTRQQLATFFRSVVEQHIHDITAQYEGAEYLVLKNPNFVRVLEEAKELLPGVQHMVCVRDPRDIVASFVKIGQRQTERGIVTHYSKRNLDFICRKITTSYQSVLADSTPDDVAVISYEKLVTDAKCELRRVATYTGLPLYVDAIEGAHWLKEEYRHLAEGWVTGLEGLPPTPESVRNYQTLLTNEEVGFVEQQCRELMARFGYESIYVQEGHATDD